MECKCKLYNTMTKTQTEKKEENYFMMQRLRPSSKSLSVMVDFNPIQKSVSHSEQIIPVFNHDRNYFTSSFIIKKDKNFIDASLEFQKLKFEERIKNSYEKSLQNPLTVAEPNSKYCQICQVHFLEYLNHINDISHQLSLHKTDANQMILQLCKQYENLNQKTKTIKKSTHSQYQLQSIDSNKRILRSRNKNKNSQQTLNVKNFSVISTKINTSQQLIN